MDAARPHRESSDSGSAAGRPDFLPGSRDSRFFEDDDYRRFRTEVRRMP